MPTASAKVSDVAPGGVPPEVMLTASELVACGSLEMGADAPSDAARIAELLPAGTPVYVNHLPKYDISHTLKALTALRDANLEPVPHVAVRRIVSRDEVKNFLDKAVRAAGVSKILLLGGDVAAPAGPYSEAADLLREDFIGQCGLSQVGLAGYPEGHPRIATAALNTALEQKLVLASQRGLSPYVVTQFSFAPNRIVEFCADLARRAPGVPVYVGLAGPSSPVSLLKYAQRCGVSASLRALQAEGMRAVRLITHVDPTDQLLMLARHAQTGSASNVVGVHLFSFGGVARTAAWMNERITVRAA
jgi:methylenetetrahydrofolate reductase (NADPH)